MCFFISVCCALIEAEIEKYKAKQKEMAEKRAVRRAARGQSHPNNADEDIARISET